MPYATEIDFSDARKVQRQQASTEAAKRRMNELVSCLKHSEPMGSDWVYTLYILFLEYGINLKLLMPTVATLNPWLSPIIWAFAEILSYQAKRLRVKETKLDKSL